MARDCKHGMLARSCKSCEFEVLEDENRDLREEFLKVLEEKEKLYWKWFNANAMVNSLLAGVRGHNGANINKGKHPIHPKYGPCDALMDGGACSVCVGEVEKLREALTRIEVGMDCGAYLDSEEMQMIARNALA